MIHCTGKTHFLQYTCVSKSEYSGVIFDYLQVIIS